jgi:nitrite reductase (NADH) large subunit
VERKKIMRVHTAIIGNGIAGFFAARTLRALDPNRSITLITHEDEYFYSRPLIPHLLAGELSRSDLILSSAPFYQEKKIELIKGARVTSVDFAHRKLFLQNKKEIVYNQLLIASGGLPRPLEKAGYRRKGVYPFRTLLDAERIRRTAQKSKNALVAGGGLVGMKIAHGLNQLGLGTTVIVSSPQVLSRTLDAKAARVFQSLFEERGIRFLFNDEVIETMERTSSKDQIWGVVTKQKRRIQGDFLVVGKGVNPNVDLFRETSLRIRDGIVVGSEMKTNLKNIFAAGDVVEAPGLLNGERRVISIWPNAAEQGKIAAHNMAGEHREYLGGLPMNALEFDGLSAISMGLIQPPSGDGYEERFYESPSGKIYQKLVLKENRIVGAVFLQEIRNAGTVLEALRNGMNVEPVKEKLIKRSAIPEYPFVAMEVLY